MLWEITIPIGELPYFDQWEQYVHFASYPEFNVFPSLVRLLTSQIIDSKTVKVDFDAGGIKRANNSHVGGLNEPIILSESH
jgi:hypothetical protein